MRSPTPRPATLAISNPEPGGEGIVITNQMHDDIHAPLVKAQNAVEKAEDAYRDSWSHGFPWATDSRRGQHVLDTEMKRFTHILRMAAFNTAVTMAREIRTNPGYKRANREAHNLVRQILTQSGDIDPTVPGFLTITLDPMPTKRETRAATELCRSLTETRTRHPGTELVLRYTIKERL